MISKSLAFSPRELRFSLLALVVIFVWCPLFAQNKYQLIPDWAQLPTAWGVASSVTTDSSGTIYVLRRAEPSFFIVDNKGKFIKAWGEGLFTWAHGVRVDRDGFIWATDGRGHLVYKFSKDGKMHLKLGKKDVAGDGPDTFNRPTDVVVAPNGDFFVSDGYVNSRVAKFSKDGKFIKAWGTKGNAPGQFNLPHTIVMDSRGRVIVGDRENLRIQIFDQEGKFIDQWSGLGKPYGLYISRDDTLYVADANAGKITIVGRDGKTIDVITDIGHPHWVTLDAAGNIYAADVGGETVRKIVKR